MLFISLIASLLCFSACHAALKKNRHQVGGAATWCMVVAFFGPMLLGTFSFPTLVYAGILLALLLAWANPTRSIRSFRWASLLALMLVYCFFSYQAYRELAGYQEKFAVVDVQKQLPSQGGQQQEEKPTLTASAREHLLAIEEKWHENDESFPEARMRLAVHELHRNAFLSFTMSSSFGVSRMPTTYWYLSLFDRQQPSPREQSYPLDMSTLSVGQVENLRDPSFRSFEHWLLRGILHFVPRHSLGYELEKQQFAGFQSHGQRDYTQRPGKDEPYPYEHERLSVNRLDLVSLLLHEKPIVYVSDKLPNMAEVKGLPTRPLNSFELVGLAKLQAGETIFVKEYQGRTLVLGALRNAKQCQACHEGPRGKLLGAFSYDLERTR
jgi:hypothetical protein